MKDILRSYYGIQTRDKIRYKGIEGYRDDQYLYFIIPATYKETIYMEQAALAYYLVENGYHNIAIPIPTVNGDWFCILEEKPYMAVRVEKLQNQHTHSHGELLAQFHQYGSEYSYEPQEISSYGHWKNLWINKLTAFENKIQEEAQNHPNPYYRLVMDILPYIVGISENAIQYVQESDSETRFHLHDQGTIVFHRYKNNLQDSIIWVNDLVYDHPVRDIADYIRHQLLWGEPNEIETFLRDYQSVRPLSVFSWRLLYARLIFPSHLYDCLERGFLIKDFDSHYQELDVLLKQQEKYEQKLAIIFDTLHVDYQTLRLPVLHWLKDNKE